MPIVSGTSKPLPWKLQCFCLNSFGDIHTNLRLVQRNPFAIIHVT